MKLSLRFIHKSFLLILVVLVGCPTTEETNKTDPDTLLNQRIGIFNNNKGQYDKKISDFTKAIELNPSAEAYCARGIIYSYKSSSEFYKGMCIYPESAEAYLRSAHADFDKAISDFNKAIGLNPKYAKAYCGRGGAYNDMAINEFFKGRMCKEIDPKSAEEYNRRYNAYLDKAISDYNKAIEVNPEYPEAYEFRSRFYRWKGQSDKAKADDNRAMEKFYWRAISYQLKSQYEKACFDFGRACVLGSEAACGEIHMFKENGFFCQQTQSWILKIKSNRVIQ